MTRDTCHIDQVLTEGYIWSLHCVVRSFRARSFHFIVRSFHSFSVKLDVKYTFLASWLKGWGIHMSNALVSAYDSKFSLYCGTILLFCGMIWLGTIWPWNKVNGYLDWFTTKYRPVVVNMICWPTRGWCRSTSQLMCRRTPFFTAIISVYMFF